MLARTPQQLSEPARRIFELLRRLDATAPDRAVTDREIAGKVHCPVRNVIDHVVELAGVGIAILASCGKRGAGARGKGRYIEVDAGRVLAYSKGLHGRAKKIHMRAKHYRDLARRMEEQNAIDSRGQRRLFA
jgi:hypothetical protein